MQTPRPSFEPSYCSRAFFLVFRRSSDPEVPSSVLGLPSQISGAKQGAPIPLQAIQGLHWSPSPETRSSLTPQEPSSLRQLPFSGSPQPPPCHSSMSSLGLGLLLSHRTPAAPGLPPPSNPGHSQFHDPPDLSPRPLLGFPGSPSPSNPSCPGHSRVTPSSGQVTTGHPPVWDPGRSCLPKDLSHTHTGRGQSTRLEQHYVPRELPAWPDWVRSQPTWPTRTPPPGAGPFSHQPSQRELAAAAAPASALAPARPGPQSRALFSGLRLRSAKLEFSAQRQPPDLRAALPALTCHYPRPTPAPLPLPRLPVATKRHRLPHDNRPTPFYTSYLSIG